MTFIHEKIRLNCENLQRLMTLSDVSITDVQYIPCTYKTTNTPPPLLTVDFCKQRMA